MKVFKQQPEEMILLRKKIKQEKDPVNRLLLELDLRDFQEFLNK